MTPSASAASVPGRSFRCSSANAAVRLRYGSTQTTRAPFLRAAVICGVRWLWVLRLLMPHSTISRACGTSSGSTARRDP